MISKEMLQHQVCILRRLLQPNVQYSTAIVLDNNRTQSLLQKLSNEFDDVGRIKKALKNSELNNIHFDEWRSRISVMKKVHFTDGECFKIISKYPSLLLIPLDQFEKSTMQWFCSDLGLNNVHLLLLSQPQLFQIEVNVINKRLPKLRALFRTSRALIELLIKSPNVLYDNWEQVLQKINYLTVIQRFTMGDIMKSSALGKSLHFIKFRFDLLEKCGIYKQDYTPIHKLNKYDKSKHVNPSLKSILNIPFNDFLSVAKISSEEYAVCKDLFRKNENFNDEDDDDGDNNDDGDVDY